MKRAVWILIGVVLGSAAGAVALAQSTGGGQTGERPRVVQYCTDTGTYNNTDALDTLVKKAGHAGWELIGVYRPAIGSIGQIGVTLKDYVCFARPR